MSWKDEIWAAYKAGDLTRAERDVLLRLSLHRGRGGVCWPSQARLATLAQCCLSTVGRAIKAAQELGLLVVQACYRRIGDAVRRTVNLYHLILPTETTTSQNDGAGMQKNLFLSVLSDPVDAGAALMARIAADRSKKIAHEWLMGRGRREKQGAT